MTIQTLTNVRHLLAVSLLTLALVACGDDHEDDHGHEDADAEVCEHMANGPSQPAVASATPAVGELPDISAAHTRHDVGLVDDGNGGFLGYVGFAASEATDYLVAVDREITLEVTGPDSTVIAAESTEANPDCADVTHRLYELPVGTSTLSFTSTSQDQVRVVIEEASHDEHAE